MRGKPPYVESCRAWKAAMRRAGTNCGTAAEKTPRRRATHVAGPRASRGPPGVACPGVVCRASYVMTPRQKGRRQRPTDVDRRPLHSRKPRDDQRERAGKRAETPGAARGACAREGTTIPPAGGELPGAAFRESARDGARRRAGAAWGRRSAERSGDGTRVTERQAGRRRDAGKKKGRPAWGGKAAPLREAAGRR